MNELEHVRSGVNRYCGTLKKLVYTKFDLLVYNSDTPEQRELVGIESGKLGMCWGVCASTEWKTLASCAHCRRKRAQRIVSYYQSEHNTLDLINFQCRYCRDFDLVGTTSIFGTKPNKPYPKTDGPQN